MKIKSRKELLDEYHDKYSIIELDDKKRIQDHFKNNNLDYNKALSKAYDKMVKINNTRCWKTIKIVLYEHVMKTDRPRHTRFGRSYSPNAKSNNDYLGKNVRKVLKAFKLLNTSAKINISAYIEMPDNVPADEIILYEAKVLKVLDTPDYDNIAKCYTDMLKDNIVIDDDIFYTGTLTKYYSLLPRIEIIIEYLEKHESDYVFKKLKKRKSIKEAIDDGKITLLKIEE